VPQTHGRRPEHGHVPVEVSSVLRLNYNEANNLLCIF
jgi:hypothetical protein